MVGFAQFSLMGKPDMKTIARCPYCDGKIRLGDAAASFISCPRCRRAFTPTMAVNDDVQPRNGVAAPPLRSSGPQAAGDDEQDSVDLDARSSGSVEVTAAAWSSTVGAVGLTLAAFGFASASVLGVRSLTATLSILGLAVAVLGTLLAFKTPKLIDRVWLTGASVVSLSTLGLMLLSPGTLYRDWAMDKKVLPSDQNLLVVISTNKEDDLGRPLLPEEWVDAAGQAIRQDDVGLRIMSVQRAPLNEGDTKGPQFLLIQFRLANTGVAQPIVFEGFRKDTHQPTLKDETERHYAFQEQRKKMLSSQGPMFLSSAPASAKVAPWQFTDYELVFEPPPKKTAPLKLELPASAWGRTGVCRIRIEGLFESVLPTKGKGKEKP
jgi:hypothetical protein